MATLSCFSLKQMAARVFLAQDMCIMGLSPPDVSPNFRCFGVFDSIVIFLVKTGRWGGVVIAFITMSDIKDEIDWEFPGANITSAQSNYFWQGIIRTYQSVFSPLPSRIICVSCAADKTQGRRIPGFQIPTAIIMTIL
jgi:hypothetical protein